MRFYSEYKDYKTKKVENINIALVDTFLDEYTIDVECGWTFRGIDLLFLNHAPEKRVEKEKKLYDIYARIEIKSSFENAEKIDVLQFRDAFYMIKNSVKRVENIPASNMDFDLKKLMSALEEAERNLFESDQELIEYSKKMQAIKRNNRLREVNHYLKYNQENIRELNKRIVGIRTAYLLDQDNVSLEPYLYRYENIFSNLLAREEWMLPGYSEIYINISKSIEDAKIDASIPEAWGKDTYAKIDVERYLNATEEEKRQIVLELMCSGLRMIADFDHLEKDKLEKVISIVEQKGIDMELIYKEKENDIYSAKVVYQVPSAASDDALYQLQVTNKRTGSEKRVDLGYANLWFGPVIKQIRITKKEIIVEGRKGFSAELTRRHNSIKENYRFSMEELNVL